MNELESKLLDELFEPLKADLIDFTSQNEAKLAKSGISKNTIVCVRIDNYANYRYGDRMCAILFNESGLKIFLYECREYEGQVYHIPPPLFYDRFIFSAYPSVKYGSFEKEDESITIQHVLLKIKDLMTEPYK